MLITIEDARTFGHRVAWSTVPAAEGARRERLHRALGRYIIDACAEHGAIGAMLDCDLSALILQGKIPGDVVVGSGGYQVVGDPTLFESAIVAFAFWDYSNTSGQ